MSSSMPDAMDFDIPAEYEHPNGWTNVPLTTVNYYDVTSRGYLQADYSQSFRFLGTHYL